jgi:hypothetical protein
MVSAGAAGIDTFEMSPVRDTAGGYNRGGYV